MNSKATRRKDMLTLETNKAGKTLGGIISMGIELTAKNCLHYSSHFNVFHDYMDYIKHRSKLYDRSKLSHLSSHGMHVHAYLYSGIRRKQGNLAIPAERVKTETVYLDLTTFCLRPCWTDLI